MQKRSREEWQQLIQQWQSSGQKATQWCRDRPDPLSIILQLETETG